MKTPLTRYSIVINVGMEKLLHFRPCATNNLVRQTYLSAPNYPWMCPRKIEHDLLIIIAHFNKIYCRPWHRRWNSSMEHCLVKKKNVCLKNTYITLDVEKHFSVNFAISQIGAHISKKTERFSITISILVEVQVMENVVTQQFFFT